MSASEFDVDVAVDPRGDLVVRVAGDFDIACVPTFDRVVHEAAAASGAMTDVAMAASSRRVGGCVVVDVSGATMLDSAAIGALIRLRRRLADEGTRLDVLVDRPFQVRLFEITSLTEHLRVRRVAQPTTQPTAPPDGSAEPVRSLRPPTRHQRC